MNNTAFFIRDYFPNTKDSKLLELIAHDEALQEAAKMLDEIYNAEFYQSYSEKMRLFDLAVLSYEAKLEGKEEGREEGRVEGKEEGITETRFDVAKKLLSLGLSTDIITNATQLSLEEIMQLKID